MIDSYDKLTIGKYEEIKTVLTSGKDDVEMNVEIVGILTDLTAEDVLELPIGTFNRLLQGTAFLYNEPTKRQVAQLYNLGGYELIPVLNVNDMTTAQFLDYQEYIKSDNLIGILSVFLIPKGCTYGNNYDVYEIQNVIKNNLSIVDARSLSDFFFAWFQGLFHSTLTYLTKKMKKMEKKAKTQEEKKKIEEALASLADVGDGYQWLIQSAKQ